jgi:geranylgeranyl diphosphate synthase type II
MQTFAEKAFNALNQLSLPEERKQYLRNFADSLLIREK